MVEVDIYPDKGWLLCAAAPDASGPRSCWMGRSHLDYMGGIPETYVRYMVTVGGLVFTLCN